MNTTPQSLFGRAIIDATNGLTKSATSGPISTVAGGHEIIFEGEATGQMIHARAPMGRPQTLAKAERHIGAYEREDGTKVAAHTRGGAAKPTPARAVAAKLMATSPHKKQADEHSILAASHERAANQCGPDSPLYGPHIELAALNLSALRHAYRAGNGRNQVERDNSARALRHLRKLIAAGERSLKGDTEATPAATGASTPTPMTKSSGLAPILFMRPNDLPTTMAKALPPIMPKAAPKRRPFDTLLREMAVAQGLPTETFL